MLTNQIKQDIKMHAHSVSPKECCGLILQSGEKIFIYPCKNISSNSEKFFEISPLEYLKAYNGGNNQVIGIYHSQENINPSLYDYVNASGHNIYSVVYSWKHNTFFEINESVTKYIGYIGKEFKIGETDCFSLIRDFYSNEFGILIKDYFRDDNWYKSNPNIIKENYEKEGFHVVKGELKTGDVIIFNMLHFGIYIENDILLHHPRKKYSTAERLTNTWKNHIDICVRHFLKNNE